MNWKSGWPIVLLLSSFLLATQLQGLEKKSEGKNGYFLVLDVLGPVLQRSSYSLNWNKITKNDRLLEGELIQVGASARIVLLDRTTKRGISQKNKATQLVISLPLTFRLSQDIVRKVQVSRFTLKASSQINGDPSQIQSARQFLDEAWNRAAAVMTGTKQSLSLDQDFINQEIKKKGMLALDNSQRIKILNPVSSSIFNVAEFPVEIPIIWDEVGGGNHTYSISRWAVNSQQNGPEGFSKSPRYILRFLETGSYFIQVGTEDESWKSEPIIVHIQKKAKNLISRDEREIPKNKQEKYLGTPAIEFTYPPEQFKKIAKKAPIPIEFYWRTSQAEEKFSGEIHIRGPKLQDTKLMISSRFGEQASIQLNPGQYTWNAAVEITRNGQVYTYETPQQSFSLSVDSKIEKEYVFAAMSDPKAEGTIELSQ